MRNHQRLDRTCNEVLSPPQIDFKLKNVFKENTTNNNLGAFMRFSSLGLIGLWGPRLR